MAHADAIDDCNNDNPAVALVGCEAVISGNLLQGTNLAIAHSRRADLAKAKGDLVLALADRRKAVELAPEDASFKQLLVDLLLKEAQLRLDAGDNETAKELTSEILQFDKKSLGALRLRSLALMTSGKYDAALADIKLFMAASNDKVEGLILRADFNRRRGRFKAAKADADAALAIDANSVEALILRANAREALNDPESAFDDYKRLVTIDGKNQIASDGLKRTEKANEARKLASAKSRVKEFLLGRYRKSIVARQAGLSKIYGEQVLFNNKLVSRKELEKTYSKFYSDWPITSFSITSDSISIEPGPRSNTFAVQFAFEMDLGDPFLSTHLRARTRLEIEIADASGKITVASKSTQIIQSETVDIIQMNRDLNNGVSQDQAGRVRTPNAEVLAASIP